MVFELGETARCCLREVGTPSSVINEQREMLLSWKWLASRVVLCIPWYSVVPKEISHRV